MRSSCVLDGREESGDVIGVIEGCREEHRLCKIYKIAMTGELQRLPSTPINSQIAGLALARSHSFSQLLPTRGGDTVLLCRTTQGQATPFVVVAPCCCSTTRIPVYSFSSHVDRPWRRSIRFRSQQSLYARELEGRKTTRSAVPRVNPILDFTSFRLGLGPFLAAVVPRRS